MGQKPIAFQENTCRVETSVLVEMEQANLQALAWLIWLKPPGAGLALFQVAINALPDVVEVN